MSRKYRPLGHVNSWEANGATVTLALDGATLSLVRYTGHSVRITLRYADDPQPELPYAVTAAPSTEPFQVTDAGQVLIVNAGQMRVVVNLNPCRINIFNASGQLVSADDYGLGMGRLGDTVILHRSLQPEERFIGLGEKTGSMDRKGQAFTHWNTDHFGYPENADPLYLSTPFFMGNHAHGCYGLYLNNSHRSIFNFGASNDRFSSIQAEGGLLDLFYMVADTPTSIVEEYTHLTGRMSMPPKWSLGYQQCRYSYYPESEVMTLANTFRQKQIPCDVVYLDIHYMQDYKVFTFDENRFPDPKRMNTELCQMGFRTVVIADPGIKRESGYSVFDSGTKANVFVKFADGSPWAAAVWPGMSHFPDFTFDKGRQWWADWIQYYTDRGVSGIWNDMNEPACWGQMVPDTLAFDWEGQGATHREAHNVYGSLMACASRQGAEAAMQGERPFILTRAGFSGVQRHTAVWTGDNVATDAHMLAGVRLVANLGMAGVAFSGYDVGGFVGDASPELFARWISIGAFSPLFRGHSMVGTRDAEPWSFGETVEAIARNYIGLRYQLMPYIYSAFYEATQSGMPVVRALAMLYPNNAKVFESAYQNQYMFGPSLLVCPVESTQKLARVYLPEGDWYHLHTSRYCKGDAEVVVDCSINQLPVFVKRGAPVLCQQLVQSLAHPHNGVLSVHVWFGAEGTATLFDDDGVSIDGAHCLRTIAYDCPNNTIHFSATEGGMASSFTTIKIVWHEFTDRAVVTATVHGTKHQIQTERHEWMAPLPSFDPLGTAGAELGSLVYTVAFANRPEAFELQWVSERF